MVRSDKGNAVVAVMWHDGSWPELSVADKALTKEVGEKGLPVEFRSVTSESPAEFLKVIEEALQQNPACQILYISAHGFTEGLYRSNTTASPSITYQDLVAAIQQRVPKTRSIAIVMGSCHATAPTTPLFSLLPENICRFVGFTAKPSWRQVAKVFVGVAVEDQRLLTQLLSAKAPAGLDSSMKASEVARRILEPVLDSFVPDLKRCVDEKDTCETPEHPQQPGLLIDYTRDAKGEWQRTATM